MKSFLKLGLTAIAITLILNFFTVSNAKAQTTVKNEILKRMETNRNTMQTLRSSVKMVKYNSQLQESDTTEGTSMYMPMKGRDALVRIDWVKPTEETLTVVNGKYTLYRKRLDQAIVGNAKEAKGNGKASSALSFMNMSKEELNNNFTIVYLGQDTVSGGVPTWHLELTPKSKANFKMAELWVDGNGMPIQAKVVETNNDTTTVLLSDIKKNTTLNLADFQQKFTKNTKIVKG